MLPYLDSDINRAVFLNGERARMHYSVDNGIPGLFASVTNVTEPGPNFYQPNYWSAAGIQELAFEVQLTTSFGRSA